MKLWVCCMNDFAMAWGLQPAKVSEALGWPVVCVCACVVTGALSLLRFAFIFELPFSHPRFGCDIRYSALLSLGKPISSLST